MVLILSGQRAGAGQRRAEANAFFVAKRDNFDGALEPLAARGERFDHRKSRQRSVIAVVASGVAHCVDMRPQHERGCAAFCLIAGDDISGGVDPRLEGRAPADQPMKARAARLCASERKSRVRRPGPVGESRERVEPRHQLLAGHEIGVGKMFRRHFWARSSL